LGDLLKLYLFPLSLGERETMWIGKSFKTIFISPHPGSLPGGEGNYFVFSVIAG
jgi:hypothetical protein